MKHNVYVCRYTVYTYTFSFSWDCQRGFHSTLRSFYAIVCDSVLHYNVDQITQMSHNIMQLDHKWPKRQINSNIHHNRLANTISIAGLWSWIVFITFLQVFVILRSPYISLTMSYLFLFLTHWVVRQSASQLDVGWEEIVLKCLFLCIHT